MNKRVVVDLRSHKPEAVVQFTAEVEIGDFVQEADDLSVEAELRLEQCSRDEGAGSAAEISISGVMSLEEMEAVADSMQSLIRWARAAKAAVEKERRGD